MVNNTLVPYRQEPDPNQGRTFTSLSAEYIAFHGIPRTMDQVREMAIYVGGRSALEYIENWSRENTRAGIDTVRNALTSWYEEAVQVYNEPIPGDYPVDVPQGPRELANHYYRNSINENQLTTPATQPVTSSTISPVERRVARRSRHQDALTEWSQSNNTTSTQMDSKVAGVESFAARSGVSSTEDGGRETAITPADPTYGEPNTLTKKINWVGCVTCTLPTNVEPPEMRILMTKPFNFLSFEPVLAAPVGGAAITKGFFNKNLVDNLNGVNTWNATPISFPLGTIDPLLTKLTCQNYTAFANKYLYYTVLNCHYKITMQNTSTNTVGDTQVMVGFNTFKGTDRVGVYPRTDVFLAEETFFPGLKKYIIPSRPNVNKSEQAWVIIEGNYKPGQAKRNIVNDGDVKRWTEVGQPPNYAEELVLRFWRGDMNLDEFYSFKSCIRMKIQLSYTIQFKDLRRPFEYPHDLDATSVVITAPDDYLMTID